MARLENDVVDGAGGMYGVETGTELRGLAICDDQRP
jgi:uncharacterized protein (DUF779 family)